MGVKVSFAERSLKGTVLELSLAEVSDGMAVPLQRGWQGHRGLEPAEAGAAAMGRRNYTAVTPISTVVGKDGSRF